MHGYHSNNSYCWSTTVDLYCIEGYVIKTKDIIDSIPLINGMLWVDSDRDIVVYSDGKWKKVRNGFPASDTFMAPCDVMGGGSYGRGG